ncbi:uncharacterized protein K452DRAFT_289984 [Aplosporella prunicola CBS 121167]|uniref:Uncharacterized protein n=1 Tax=Aplosporella prunicola CBS 121167 TaxID=1176127 RepID=A0A6A6B7S7_9PEZI|nr:uncharacterized protein K452DRAFT_289984 [Aplosporella prunicola CBS 121167]KAF2139423.1 hypothetical protein K452DRAFT_289984 [Aplosporella prunicola CBS 121167]
MSSSLSSWNASRAARRPSPSPSPTHPPIPYARLMPYRTACMCICMYTLCPAPLRLHQDELNQSEKTPANHAMRK